MLKKTVIAITVVTLLIAIALLATGAARMVAIGIWLGIEAAILLLAILFERGRYQPGTSDGPWSPSAERFQDPTTGQWIRVEYNPRTGERRYVEEG